MVLSDYESHSSNSVDEEENEAQKEAIKQRILDVFKAFDEDDDGFLEPSEVGHSLRCLGFSPTQSDVELLCEQTLKKNGVIPFETLYRRILSATAANEWPMDAPALIEKAFETISDGKFVNRDKLLQILTTMGEPLSASEVKQLNSHLSVRRGGEVDWRAHLADTIAYINRAE